MAAVGLLYVGGVLFVNAVMLLGKAEPRSVGIFNLFVGVFLILLALKRKISRFTG